MQLLQLTQRVQPCAWEECEQPCLGWNEGNAAARLDLQAGWDRQSAVYFLEKCLEFRGLVSNPLLYRTTVPGGSSSTLVSPAWKMI